MPRRGDRLLIEFFITPPRNQSGDRFTYWPIFLCGCAQRPEDRGELLEIRLAGQIRHPKHQFCKNAAHAPHVHRCAVCACAQEELGGTVPSENIQRNVSAPVSCDEALDDRTHRVTTWLVIRAPGSAHSRAKPKSAILSSPEGEMSKLLGFKSCKKVESGFRIEWGLASWTERP